MRQGQRPFVPPSSVPGSCVVAYAVPLEGPLGFELSSMYSITANLYKCSDMEIGLLAVTAFSRPLRFGFSAAASPVRTSFWSFDRTVGIIRSCLLPWPHYNTAQA